MELCEFCERRMNDSDLMNKIIKGDQSPWLYICRCHFNIETEKKDDETI